MEEKINRVMDTKKYVSHLRTIVESGQEVSLRVSGGSMSPFLVHGRDTILFGPVEGELKKGDMVFYQRKDGTFIMHRICKVKPDGYMIVGDAQIVKEFVTRDQIFARVSKVCRKGKWIEKGDFWWDFFEKVWINLVPVRRKIIGMYILVRGGRKKQTAGK